MVKDHTTLGLTQARQRSSDGDVQRDAEGHRFYPEFGDETLRNLFEGWLQRRKGYRAGRCCFECHIELSTPYHCLTESG